nr:hypothetical protein [uncultured Acetatifactor sp.]
MKANMLTYKSPRKMKLFGKKKQKQIKKIPKKLLTKAMTCDILSKLPLMKKTAEHLDK